MAGTAADDNESGMRRHDVSRGNRSGGGGMFLQGVVSPLKQIQAHYRQVQSVARHHAVRTTRHRPAVFANSTHQYSHHFIHSAFISI